MLNMRTLLIAGLCNLAPLTFAQDSYPDLSKLSVEEITKRITPMNGSTPAQWRLTVKEDPATKATLSWSTASAEGEHMVYYGTESSKGNLDGYAHKLTCQVNGKYQPKDAKSTSYHHARINDLEPGTKYYLTMVSNGVASDEYHFFTAEEDPDELILIHGGDSRSGIKARILMNNMMANLVENQPEIYGLVHGGDYNGQGNMDQWNGWMSQHELTTTKNGRLLPVIPAKGNHDGNPLLADVFDFHPKDDPLMYCYDVNFGDHLAIITVDTNYAATGAQEEYLAEALAKWRPETTWLFTSYHRPLYPAVKSPPAHKEVFVPLFEKYNVDLALEADGHVIKRTAPIRGEKKDETGVVYIGEGGLGVGQRSPKKDRWYIDPAQGGYAGKSHHIMLLTLTENHVEIKTICLNGTVPDVYTKDARK